MYYTTPNYDSFTTPSSFTYTPSTNTYTPSSYYESDYDYTYTPSSSYDYDYDYYSGVSVSSNGLDWLYCLLFLLIVVPVCICKYKAKKQGEGHYVETVEYNNIKNGDFQKAPDSEVAAIYSPNPMGQMNPAPMMGQYGEPMQPM